jgi:hypothetical protein
VPLNIHPKSSPSCARLNALLTDWFGRKIGGQGYDALFITSTDRHGDFSTRNVRRLLFLPAPNSPQLRCLHAFFSTCKAYDIKGVMAGASHRWTWPLESYLAEARYNEALIEQMKDHFLYFRPFESPVALPPCFTSFPTSLSFKNILLTYNSP